MITDLGIFAIAFYNLSFAVCRLCEEAYDSLKILLSKLKMPKMMSSVTTMVAPTGVDRNIETIMPNADENTA